MATASPTVMRIAPNFSIRDEDGAALLAIVRRLSASWANNDADTLSQLYAEDASVVLPGDTYLKGRPAIRDWLAAAFEGKWKGTHVLGVPLEIRYINDETIVMVSHGGAYRAGASEVSVDDAIRGMWLFIKQGAEWVITAYENTPVQATIPIPATANR